MNNKSPRWVLDEHWSVDVDSYNWILYRRSFNKQNEPTGWHAVSYHPNACQLLESLHQLLTRTETNNSDLIAHLEHCYERAEGLSERLSSQLKQTVWSDLSRPVRPRKDTA